MFKIAVGDTPTALKGNAYRDLAGLSEGYSGSDIAIAVQDALMQPVRKIQQATHFKKVIMTFCAQCEKSMLIGARSTWMARRG